MKTIIGYAVVNKTSAEGLKVYNGQFPIYWYARVAQEEAEKYGGKVIKVKVDKLV